MRVPDSIKECVIFLGFKTQKNNIEAGGTGCLVGYPGKPYCYLLTAKHNALKLGSTFTARVNTKNGGYGLIEFSNVKWWFHPTDKYVDAAVTPWSPHPTIQCKYIDPSRFASDTDIQIGDDVIIAGLYFRTPGKTRNMPIVRAGIVSMLPSEKIRIQIEAGDTGEADAYLVEARSISGLSGSPVFTRQYFPDRADPKWHQFFYFLGLIHGHWELKNSPPVEMINEGIAHVVPAKKILEILEQPELTALRNAVDEELRDGNPAKSDSREPNKLTSE